jgi:hypothetical protein
MPGTGYGAGKGTDLWTIAKVIAGLLILVVIFVGIISIAESFAENAGAADTTNLGSSGTGDADTGVNVVPKETKTQTATEIPTAQETGKDIIPNIPVEVFENKGVDIENVVVSQLFYENGQLRGHITYPNIPDRHGVSIELLRLEGQGMPIGTYFNSSSDFDFFINMKEEDLNNCKIKVRLKLV